MIESLQNDKIKYLSRLITDNRFRKKSGFFSVEGKQENARARKFGFQPEDIFICEKIFNGEIPTGRINFISDKVYEKLAYRGSSEGIIGIYKSKDFSLKDFQPRESSTIIVVEGAEKPGNLGAILRSCEAFGIDALIIAGHGADFYNPNVIRSSVGCLFGMNIFTAENETVLKFLKKNSYQIFSTFMSADAEELYRKDLRKKSAIIFGTEHSGLTDFWHSESKNVLIPMAGTIDSLNLSNAVAITCYEALRQKLA